jgi:nitroreductase
MFEMVVQIGPLFDQAPDSRRDLPASPGSDKRQGPAFRKVLPERFCMTDSIQLLATRRSVPVPNLRGPGPDAGQLTQLLTIATRVPDHGKLVPWRLILIEGDKVAAFGDRLAEITAEKEPGATPERLQIERLRFRAPLVVAVVSRAAEHPKIPVWEQILSAGAVCMNLTNAANAQGFGTQWVTGWGAYDPQVTALLGLGEGEKIAGFIQIGTPDLRPEDRPRPALDTVVSRWEG